MPAFSPMPSPNGSDVLHASEQRVPLKENLAGGRHGHSLLTPAQMREAYQKQYDAEPTMQKIQRFIHTHPYWFTLLFVFIVLITILVVITPSQSSAATTMAGFFSAAQQRQLQQQPGEPAGPIILQPDGNKDEIASDEPEPVATPEPTSQPSEASKQPELAELPSTPASPPPAAPTAPPTIEPEPQPEPQREPQPAPPVEPAVAPGSPIGDAFTPVVTKEPVIEGSEPTEIVGGPLLPSEKAPKQSEAEVPERSKDSAVQPAETPSAPPVVPDAQVAPKPAEVPPAAPAVETPKEPVQVDHEPVPEPVPEPVAEPAAPVHPEAEERSSPLLHPADLNSDALLCPLPESESRPRCDWTWGPEGSSSANSEEHPRFDANPEGKWKKPQDFYAFQAGVHVSGEGVGVVVRIYQRDQCCTGDLPLSYFRVTAYGTAQAAANPPLALGPLPSAMGRGNSPVILGHSKWSRNQDVSETEEDRVLQTFLLLPDAGVYGIQVRLTHFNVSTEMVSENYAMNSKKYEERPGMWVDGFVSNARGELFTKVVIPDVPQGKLSPEALPWCGAEGALPGGASPLTKSRVGLPLSGRWVFQPPREADPKLEAWNPNADVDLTSLPPRWLVEHSRWEPFFCRLDDSLTFPRVLERMQWGHFTGDSNTRHMFYYVCEMGNGTLMSVNPERVPRFLDPPHLCFGPSSPSNEPDFSSKLTPGSASRWVLTYTNWFWGKTQTLEPDFGFARQCEKFVEQNKTGLFYGWPHCMESPSWTQKLPGPGFTYFGWGSHAAEMAFNKGTREHFKSEEAFGMPFFHKNPTIFPFTTANTPSLIPEKFGRQQIMRNNERVWASNVLQEEAIQTARQNYASATEGAHPWVPLFDLFSPTHAAYEVLAIDAVHFEKFFSYEEPRWLLHYLWHAPNYGPRQ